MRTKSSSSGSETRRKSPAPRPAAAAEEAWPSLPLAAWQDTYATLHMWSQIVGKASPVHFFWGGFDLAVTRFSGRPAPRHPGGVPNVGDWVMHDAYSHEVSSAGFWPGVVGITEAVFYSYAYPEPQGFAAAAVRPEQARYSPEMREFLLPYEAVRGAASPDQALLAFLESTFQAAAELGDWDRSALEWRPVPSPAEAARPSP